MKDGDEEIIAAFLEESRENLDQLDLDLVALESEPSDPRLLAQIFRTIHTIKGTCGFLGFHHLEALTHAGESLLGAVRSGALRLDPAVTTSLLDLVDTIRFILDLIQSSGTEGDDDHASVVAALDRHLAAPDADPGPDGQPVAPAPAATPPSGPTTPPETSVRVDVAVLDKLMNLVGELVLTRSQFGESAATDDDGPLAVPYRQLRLLTAELQEGVMRARLQPVGTVIGKFRRVVRDLAAALGKEVRIEIEGEEIGVDKAVNEALRDPLLHLVRNAVDHGIEPPDERRAAGKPVEGTLSLRAFHEGGRVHELADDGRGIAAARVVEKALASGALTPDAAAALSPEEALELMFLPGLSTRDDVTTISGRGVGLDVVRSALERVGGSIAARSAAGLGSVFHLDVPLTLAIMPVLITSVGGQRFAVPQVDVREVINVPVEEAASMVQVVGGARMHRRGGRLLPLVELAAELHLDPQVGGRGGDGPLVVVVAETTGRRFGIVVGSVGDATEVVVKPLTRAIRAIPQFCGVTILGDGEPALILDVAGLATSAGLVATHDDPGDRGHPTEDTTSSLLLVSATDGGHFAIALAAVRRLEQIACSSIEQSGPLEVVHYRGGILPLLRLADLLSEGARAAQPADVLQAVVCESSIGLVGLVVDRIEDVVRQPSVTPQPPSRRGVISRLLVNGHVTELLDVEALVAVAGLGRTA